MRTILASLFSVTLLAGCATAGNGVLSTTPTMSSQTSRLPSGDTTEAHLRSLGRTIRTANSIAVLPARGFAAIASRDLWPAQTHSGRGMKPFRESGGRYLWASDVGTNAIWQTRANFSIDKTGKKIVGELTDCSRPEGLRVDDQGDLWAVCNGTGTVNMYPPGATTASVTLKSSYTSGSLTVSSQPLDVTFDTAGNVYVSNNFVYESAASKQIAFALGGIQVFLADCGSHPCNGDVPSALIKDPNQNPKCPRSMHQCITVSGPNFIDLDESGNVYEDYSTTFYECTSNSNCNKTYVQMGVDQIRNPRRPKPKFTTVINSTTFSPGGVYTTTNGSVLNVLDQGTHVVTQYAVSSFSLIGTLGPMPGKPCDQAFIGFNLPENQIAAGDFGCPGINVGSVATNTFAFSQNPSYNTIVGVAYDPSDK